VSQETGLSIAGHRPSAPVASSRWGTTGASDCSIDRASQNHAPDYRPGRSGCQQAPPPLDDCIGKVQAADKPDVVLGTGCRDEHRQQ